MKKQFHTMGKGRWMLFASIFAAIIMLLNVIDFQIAVLPKFDFKKICEVFFLILSGYLVASILKSRLIIHPNSSIEFIGLFTLKKYHLSEIKGFHSKKGFILLTGKKADLFYSSSRYFPEEEFSEWIDANLERLD